MSPNRIELNDFALAFHAGANHEPKPGKAGDECAPGDLKLIFPVAAAQREPDVIAVEPGLERLFDKDDASTHAAGSTDSGPSNRIRLSTNPEVNLPPQVRGCSPAVANGAVSGRVLRHLSSVSA